MPESNKIELAKLFIKKARQDLKNSRLLLDNNSFGDSCYFAQQTSEKAIKSALILKTGLYPRDHLVSGYFSRELLAFIEPKWEKKLRKLLIDVVELEEFWLKPKYPYITDTFEWDPTEKYTKEDAEKAYKKAENILNTILEFIKENYGYVF